MTIPVLRVLSQTYSTLKITVISRSVFKPIFAGIAGIHFLEADVLGKHKGVGIFKLANEARALGVEAVADLHNVIRSKMIINYLGLKGIKSETINKGRAEKKQLTQNNGNRLSVLKTTHQRYADVFTKLGFPIDLKLHQFPERLQLTPHLSALVGVEPKKLIGIAPFAAYKSKMYPLQLMTEVISQLNATGKFRIFLFGGGKKEMEILKGLEAKFNSVTNLANKYPLEAELTLISNLDLMLSMDSANGHLASMYGIPVITLWGVTHPYAGFVPFNQPNSNQLVSNREKFPLIPTSVYGNKFPKGYDKAMETIPPDLVVEKVLENL